MTDNVHSDGVFRIRFHGRGGQGMKTAGRILGTALFMEGFEVQDAPRYGAERRGAPIFSYVRASREPIYERGVIRSPDLILVADDTLIGIPAAGVPVGSTEKTTLVIVTSVSADEWKNRINFPGTVLTIELPAGGETETGPLESHMAGITCVGAAARLAATISFETLLHAILEEMGDDASAHILEKNSSMAQYGYDYFKSREGSVLPGAIHPSLADAFPEWVDLPVDSPNIAAPAIHAKANSVLVKTGLWRSHRPVINRELCAHCWWICSSYCPDAVISVDEDNIPVIDYEHCKGCMICVAQCTRHAIDPVPEKGAQMGGEK